MDGSEWPIILLCIHFAYCITNTNKTGNLTETRVITDTIPKILTPKDRCASRIERALGTMSKRRSSHGSSATFDLTGYALHQPLRSAPYDMYITDLKVRVPRRTNNWVRIDNCRYDPLQSILQTRLIFSDLSISGAVKLYDEANILKNPEKSTAIEKCKMAIRLRQAGVGFTVVPRREKSGNISVNTAGTFIEPHFVSVHAYGCKEPELLERTIEGVEGRDLDMGQEMETVFLRGIQPLLTAYVEKHLHSALRDTLMINMGYSLSYGSFHNIKNHIPVFVLFAVENNELQQLKESGGEWIVI